jgi:hypothetical protein
MKTKVKLKLSKVKEERLNMVVASFLIQKLVFMTILSCCWISIHFIRLSFKNTICVSPQLIEKSPKILMAQNLRIRLKKKMRHLITMKMQKRAMKKMTFKFLQVTQRQEMPSCQTFLKILSKREELSKLK